MSVERYFKIIVIIANFDVIGKTGFSGNDENEGWKIMTWDREGVMGQKEYQIFDDLNKITKTLVVGTKNLFQLKRF